MRAAVALVLVLGMAPAAAQMVQPPARREMRVAPGSFEEMCFELAAGAAIHYAFDATGPVDFNIHFHRGDELVFPLKRGAIKRRDGVFRSPDQQAYCLMWANRGHASVLLRARIDRAD
jgi:hypothetical protein